MLKEMLNNQLMLWRVAAISSIALAIGFAIQATYFKNEAYNLLELTKEAIATAEDAQAVAWQYQALAQQCSYEQSI